MTKAHQIIISGLSCLKDKIFLFLLFLGLLAWALPRPEVKLPVLNLALAALVEEAIFRSLLQQGISRLNVFKRSRLGLSRANITVSSAFALMHLFSHPPVWALGVFFPSLAFGWAWDKHKSLFACWLLHFSYNFLYFYRF